MKILHILNSPNIGGIEWFGYYLAKVQSEREGLDVGIFFCKSEGDLKEVFNDLDVTCYYSDISAFDLNLSKYSELNKLAKEYDLIHIHSFRPIRDWLMYFNGKKIIYTNHSVLGIGRIVKKTDAIKWYLFKKFSNLKSVFITFNSEYTKEFWFRRGINNPNSKVIYNGVGFKKVKNTSLKDDLGLKDKFVVGTSSRLIEWKRVDLLIEAFNTFQKDKKDAFLIIVGDGAEKKKLQELVKFYELEGKVLFTGNVVNVEDYQYLMDVCVFPSTTEAFGLVAIECMQYGKPVLVMNDGGGIREIVENIESDNVCENIPSLTNNLDRFYENQSLLNGQFKQDRINYSQCFDMYIKEKEFEEVYCNFR